MPDITPIIIHEAALHMPAHGIACVAGNIDDHHDVYVIDLVRKRRRLVKYLTKIMKNIVPDLVGLSAMTWQYDTCVKIIRLIKHLRPEVKIALGGYHPTLLHDEIASSEDEFLIDFVVRGEGEETFRQLVNALETRGELGNIPSLSYKKDGTFVHNDRGPNLDLASLKLPLRGRGRLTGGYHFMASKIEVIETSRGCTRMCNFCSIRHMYGRSIRYYPLERVIADLDDIYYNKKTRLVFISDDNMVLNSRRVMDLCDAIIARGYKKLKLIVQADCRSLARNEAMVEKMARAGFVSIFIGIENGSKINLELMDKPDIVEDSRRAVDLCRKYGIMSIAGMIFGLPDDDGRSIKENFEFYNSIGADTSYMQIVTPYPKTGIRDALMAQGMVTNGHDFSKYNGLWANVRTKHLTCDELQYWFWYYRQTVLGWWNPSSDLRKGGWLWISLWNYCFKPVARFFVSRSLKKNGWDGRFKNEIRRLERLNVFTDLESSCKAL